MILPILCIGGCKSDSSTSTSSISESSSAEKIRLKKKEILKKDYEYHDQLQRLTDPQDSLILTMILDTISEDKLVYAFYSYRSYRLNHHLTKYGRREGEIRESLFNWFPHNFYDCRFNYDLNLAKFQFYTNTPDSIINKFMDICLVDGYRVFDKNDQMVLNRIGTQE